MTIGLTLGRAAPNAGSAVEYPFGFLSNWQPEFNIAGSGVGGYRTDYNPALDKPTGITLWVDNTSGDDTTGNGSQSTPYKTIAKAVTEGADIINIKSGNYWRNDSWVSEFQPAKDMAFVAIDGPGTVKIGRGVEGLSWSSVGSNSYSTTRSNVRTVLDFTEAGHATKKLKDGITPVLLPMEKLADLAAVQASAGHSWAQVGTTLYVKTHDGRAPDADIVPLLIERNTRLVDADITLYFEGLEIFGDRPIFFYFNNVSNTARFVGVNCGFRYSGESNQIAQRSIQSPISALSVAPLRIIWPEKTALITNAPTRALARASNSLKSIAKASRMGIIQMITAQPRIMRKSMACASMGVIPIIPAPASPIQQARIA